MSLTNFGSFLSSGSSINPSIAWARGSRGEGRFRIKFPLESTWYQEQACTHFQSLQHRKERSGHFQHEFIVLKLENNSICRIERMGDPDASFNAIGAQGIAAHDVIQSFPSNKLSEACLETSDVVAEIQFPCYFDLKIVLLICRAIQEGEQTCNYTLQVFNCYFFALTIQAVLTRIVTDWGHSFRDEIWHLTLGRGLSVLSDFYKAVASDRDQQPFMLQPHSVLQPDTRWPSEDLICNLKRELHRLTEVSQMCNATLWYADARLAIEHELCKRVRDTAMGVLKDQLHQLTDRPSCATRTDSPRLDLVVLRSKDLLLELISRAVSSSEQLQTPRISRIQSGVQRKNDLIREFGSFLSGARLAKEWTLDFLPSNPQSRPDPPQPHSDSPRPHSNSPEPQVSVWFVYARILALWASHVVLGLFGIILLGSAQPASCVFIEDELGPGLSIEHENVDGFTFVLQRLCSLISTPRVLVQWKEWPWDHIYRPIRHHMLRSLAIETGLLVVSFSDSTGQTMMVSKFQEHILERIRDHAKRVESYWLGSAVGIQAEMEDRISQVWALIRPDDTAPAPGKITASTPELKAKASEVNRTVNTESKAEGVPDAGNGIATAALPQRVLNGKTGSGITAGGITSGLTPGAARRLLGGRTHGLGEGYEDEKMRAENAVREGKEFLNSLLARVNEFSAEVLEDSKRWPQL